jgi:hypothetical protein
MAKVRWANLLIVVTSLVGGTVLFLVFRSAILEGSDEVIGAWIGAGIGLPVAIAIGLYAERLVKHRNPHR